VVAPGVVRIIGGQWRGRQIKVLSDPNLRPTPDRVRETLFNWLMGHIVNASCLDLFAGTGVLGFEALSRGAKRVVFVDNFAPGVQALKSIAAQLGAADQCEIVRSDALSWLEKPTHSAFDVIFLDPPYREQTLLQQTIDRLANSPLISAKTLIYIEAPEIISPDKLPSAWQLLKQKTAGEVAYHLVQGG